MYMCARTNIENTRYINYAYLVCTYTILGEKFDIQRRNAGCGMAGLGGVSGVSCQLRARDRQSLAAGLPKTKGAFGSIFKHALGRTKKTRELSKASGLCSLMIRTRWCNVL